MDYGRANELMGFFLTLSRWRYFRAKVLGRKVFVGEWTRKNWSGYLPFYLFKCPACGGFSCDYPHGYLDHRYLTCHRCDARVDFVPWWAPLADLPAFGEFCFRFFRREKR